MDPIVLSEWLTRNADKKNSYPEQSEYAEIIGSSGDFIVVSH
jgi:hypothetical protein